MSVINWIAARRAADEQYAYWRAEGLGNEAMIEAVTGWTVRSASKAIVLDILARSLFDARKETAADAVAAVSGYQRLLN